MSSLNLDRGSEGENLQQMASFVILSVSDKSYMGTIWACPEKSPILEKSDIIKTQKKNLKLFVDAVF